MPSSAATSTASEVASFVTDVHGSGSFRSPRVATTPPERTTPAAARPTGQASIARRASTGGDTRGVERRLIPGHSPLEPVVGYSRAVVAGGHVYVAGTAPIPREGDPPAGAYEQARLCLEIVGTALAEAGAAFRDVVRTRVYLTEAADWEDVGRAHGEVFGEIRPASAMLVVKELLDPRWRVEIEADAVLTS